MRERNQSYSPGEACEAFRLSTERRELRDAFSGGQDRRTVP